MAFPPLSMVYRSEKQLPHLFQILQTFYESGEFCDVTVSAGDCKVHAHRVILAAFSPYIYETLHHQHSSHPCVLVTLPELDHSALKKMIEFCYTGVISVDTSNVVNILSVARVLHIREVEKLCDTFLTAQRNFSSELSPESRRPTGVFYTQCRSTKDNVFMGHSDCYSPRASPNVSTSGQPSSETGSTGHPDSDVVTVKVEPTDYSHRHHSPDTHSSDQDVNYNAHRTHRDSSSDGSHLESPKHVTSLGGRTAHRTHRDSSSDGSHLESPKHVTSLGGRTVIDMTKLPSPVMMFPSPTKQTLPTAQSGLQRVSSNTKSGDKTTLMEHQLERLQNTVDIDGVEYTTHQRNTDILQLNTDILQSTTNILPTTDILQSNTDILQSTTNILPTTDILQSNTDILQSNTDILPTTKTCSKCPFCQATFYNTIEYRLHLLFHQQKRDGLSVTTTSDTVLGSGASDQGLLSSGEPHLSLEPGQVVRASQSGTWQGYRSSNVMRYISQHRRGSQSQIPSNSDFRCGTCGKQFKDSQSLKFHRYNHVLRHSCNVCGKRFSRSWNLLRHRKTHFRSSSGWSGAHIDIPDTLNSMTEEHSNLNMSDTLRSAVNREQSHLDMQETLRSMTEEQSHEMELVHVGEHNEEEERQSDDMDEQTTNAEIIDLLKDDSADN